MPKRRRGARSAPRHVVHGRHARFEELVERALSGIPSPFRECLDEVAIVIDDLPTPDQLADNELDDDGTLYGIYEGVPRTEYGSDWVAAPNRITLFRLALEADFPHPDDLAEEVRITVIHELAHHLGIGDERLGELGVD